MSVNFTARFFFSLLSFLWHSSVISSGWFIVGAHRYAIHTMSCITIHVCVMCVCAYVWSMTNFHLAHINRWIFGQYLPLFFYDLLLQNWHSKELKIGIDIHFNSLAIIIKEKPHAVFLHSFWSVDFKRVRLFTIFYMKTNIIGKALPRSPVFCWRKK